MRYRLAVAALLPYFQKLGFQIAPDWRTIRRSGPNFRICLCAKERVRLGAVHAHPTTLFGPNYLGENIYSGDPGFAALLVRGF
jgi:hypothetical protein